MKTTKESSPKFEYMRIEDARTGLGGVEPLEIKATQLSADGWRIIAVVQGPATRIATLERIV